MNANFFEGLSEMLVESISDIKVKHQDAIIILGGDMNRHDFGAVMQAYLDIVTVDTPPTRVDLFAINIEGNRMAVEIFPPLQNE